MALFFFDSGEMLDNLILQNDSVAFRDMSHQLPNAIFIPHIRSGCNFDFGIGRQYEQRLVQDNGLNVTNEL